MNIQYLAIFFLLEQLQKKDKENSDDWFNPKGVKPNPCPFCGSTKIRAVRKIADDHKKFAYWLQCHNCGATGTIASSQEEAEKKWGVKENNHC